MGMKDLLQDLKTYSVSNSVFFYTRTATILPSGGFFSIDNIDVFGI